MTMDAGRVFAQTLERAAQDAGAEDGNRSDDKEEPFGSTSPYDL